MTPDSKFEDILLELMKSESIQRQENQNLRRLKAAQFPYQKTLDELDLSRYDGSITQMFLNELASCKFITEKKNIVMIGNPGRGKTHLSIGLGLKARSQGLNVLFKNAAALLLSLPKQGTTTLWGDLKIGYKNQTCLFWMNSAT
jgi:DNA replication protein DnaC